MNNLMNDPEWQQYLETPRHMRAPVKIDKILARRMQEFLRARKVKPFKKHILF